MFYETRIFDAHGNLKQIISAQEIQHRHWQNFTQSEENLSVYPRKNSSPSARKMRTRYKGLSLNHH
jgi:hypothetical protein